MLFSPVLHRPPTLCHAHRWLSTHSLLLALIAFFASRSLAEPPVLLTSILCPFFMACLLGIIYVYPPALRHFSDRGLWLMWCIVSSAIVTLVAATPLFQFMQHLLFYSWLCTGCYLWLHSCLTKVMYHPYVYMVAPIIIFLTLPFFIMQPSLVCACFFSALWTAWLLYDTHYHHLQCSSSCGLALLPFKDMAIAFYTILT